MHAHAVNDRIGLELARLIAARLPSHPEWIDLARDNLSRWSSRNAGVPSLVRCYEEWRELLNRPIPEVQGILVQENDEGQRLRQNSPFAGALSAREVWGVKQRCFDEARAA